MAERIVYTNPDGSCAVVIPAPNTGLTIAEIFARDVPAFATNARVIDHTQLPADRLFRNAWDDSNPEDFVGLNLPKAKEIAHGFRRVKRDAQMAPLDKEENFVSTPAARRAEIVDEKIAILDANALVQADIDAAADEAELRLALTNGSII